MTNFVLICTDQWRADCFSAVRGQDGPDTPFLDTLMEGGVRAECATSASPTCVPARMSLLTGLKASTHRRVGYIDGVDFDQETTMAGEFSRQGFQTQAIGKMHVWPVRARAGFDNVILHDGYLHHSRKNRPDPRFYDDYTSWLYGQQGTGAFPDEYDNAVHCNAVAAHPWDKPERFHPTNWVTDQAIDWLYRRDTQKPFFLFLSYHRPHAPYNPPRWAFDMYRDRPVTRAPIGNWEADYLDTFRDDANPRALVADYSDHVLQDAVAGYFGNITHLDSQIERFVEALADFNLFDDTVLCFTSDHGDMMGDHGMWRKGFPYASSTNVPLFFAGPGITQGKVVTEQIELMDLMPTLLDLSGLDIPDGLDGASAAAHIAADPASVTGSSRFEKREFLHGEHTIFGQSLQWIHTPHHKYIWWSKTGREQLFNLDDDPGELTDLLVESARNKMTDGDRAALQWCKEKLVTTLTGREEGFVDEVTGELVAGRPVSEILSTSHRPVD